MISSNIIRGYTHLRMFCWNESHGKRRTYYHITDNRRSCCLEKCEQRSLTQKIINSFISVRDSLGVIFLLFTVAYAVFLFVPPLYQNGFDILLRLKEYASERKKEQARFRLCRHMVAACHHRIPRLGLRIRWMGHQLDCLAHRRSVVYNFQRLICHTLKGTVVYNGQRETPAGGWDYTVR